MTLLLSSGHVRRTAFATIFILVACSIAAQVGAQSAGYPYYQPQPMVGGSQQQVAPFRAPSPMTTNQPGVGYYVADNSRMGSFNPGMNTGINYESWPCTQPGYSAAPQATYAGPQPGGWCDASQGGCGFGTSCCQCTPAARWGGYVGTLALFRDDENHRFFSYDSANEAYQLLDSRDSNFDYGPGVEAHILRMDACCCTGCEVVYWGIFPGDQYAYAYPSQVTGSLNGIFNFDQLDYNGNSADNYVNNAMVHRLRRNTEIHNAELNRIWFLSRGGCGSCGSGCYGTGMFGGACDGGCYGGGCNGSGWSFQTLLGFRYLRFDDDLEFASDPVDTMFTGAVDELYYTINTSNNLYGVQLGGIGSRAICSSRCCFTFGAKAGVFVNDANSRSTIGGAAGLATINNGPNLGAAWDISSSDQDIATIAELQAGISCPITQYWRVRGDYRIIGISGVALPTNQIYQDLRGIQDVALLARNGSLFLHGVFLGLEHVY